jgi:hypothetical protein
VPDGGAEGVVIAQGGQAGGWSLYVHEGALSCCYNFFGVDRFFVRASAPLPPGDHEVRFAFDYDGGGHPAVSIPIGSCTQVVPGSSRR